VPGVRHLATVARVGKKENVDLFQFRRGRFDVSQDPIACRLFCQSFGYFRKSLRFRQRLHVVCVELARGELSVPSAILFWIDGVETDVERSSNWHTGSFRF